jgi:hypothetical protein
MKEEGMDNCSWIEGRCGAHKVQEENEGKEYGTGKRGVID